MFPISCLEISPEIIEQLVEIVNGRVESHGAPGIFATLFQGDQIFLEQGVGVRATSGSVRGGGSEQGIDFSFGKVFRQGLWQAWAVEQQGRVIIANALAKQEAVELTERGQPARGGAGRQPLVMQMGEIGQERAVVGARDGVTA